MDGHRGLAVGLAILLWASVLATGVGPTGVAPAAGQEDDGRVVPVSPEENTTEYLAIPSGSLDAAGTTTGDLDVAAAVGRNAGTLRGEYRGYRLDRTIEDLPDDEEAAVLRESADDIDDRIAVLEARERTIVEGYSDGSISGPQLLRRLAIIDAEARALDDLVRTLHSYHQRTDDSGLSERELAIYRSRLAPLQGPVRERVGDATAGGDPVLVYVESREGDVTLATVESEGLTHQFIREIHVRDHRDIDGESQLDFDAARDRFQELYPWAAANGYPENFGAVGGIPYLTHADVYPVGVGQPHGFGTPTDLTTYIDGSTTDVFLEVQYQDPEKLPTATTATEEAALRLEINYTRAGGPLGITVIDTTTGDPVAAGVDVNGVSVGTSGSRPLWTVAPRGPTTITATHDDREVTLETEFE